MERFGLVGLPNAGKSSLFNALAGGGALAAPYPFSTKDPNVGVASVPDPRVEALATMSRSREVVHATVEFVDIGGLVAGASEGEGLGNRFLGAIRDVDAVVYVLRAFDDPDVPGSSDPLEGVRILETELTLADLETIAARLEKQRKAARADRSLSSDVEALEAAYRELGDGRPIYRSKLSDDARDTLRPHFLLTDKPVLAVVNVGEDDVDRIDERTKVVVDEMDERAEVLGMCVQIEAEAAQLPVEDRAELLEGFGLGAGALPRFVEAAYQLLGRRTFFSTRENETRAWTIRAGATAREAAGAIHSDFERGFIRAETIRCDLLLEAGSWARAREAGLVRSEGKDYEVADGEVIEFRFNV